MVFNGVCYLYRLVVPQKAIGTAYGFGFMVQGLFMGVMPYLMGFLVPTSEESVIEYSKFSLAMVLMTVASTLMALFLYVYDKMHSKVLLSKCSTTVE